MTMTSEAIVNVQPGASDPDLPAARPAPGDGSSPWHRRTWRDVMTDTADELAAQEALAGSFGDLSMPDDPVIDMASATDAARKFLACLGVDVGSESLERTPYRMAKAYSEFFSPRPFTLRMFDNDGGYQGLIVVRAIPMQSICEHHLLPFVGVAHVGYLPGERIAGLSKLARAVQYLARRPQVQERLTEKIAAWLQEQLGARGVGVFIRAEHSCMTLRGANAHGAETITQSFTGALLRHGPDRSEFLRLCV
jgi:GTP cyclohydrolase I